MAESRSSSTRSSSRSSTRKTPATKSTQTARRQTARTRQSTARKRAQATRATNRAQARTRQATRKPRTRVEQAQQLAERALLVQVGAALEARDRVVNTVTGVVDTYTKRSAAERQIRKFERRGKTARTQIERELRQRRRNIERVLNRNERRIERDLSEIRRDGNGLRRNLEANLDLVAAQVENAVQSGITAGAKLVARGTDRVVAA